MGKNEHAAAVIRLALCGIGLSCLAVAGADYLAGPRLRAQARRRRRAPAARLHGENEAGNRSHDGPASEAGFKSGVKTTFDVIDVVRQLVLESLELSAVETEVRGLQGEGRSPDGSSE